MDQADMPERTSTPSRSERLPDGSALLHCRDLDGAAFTVPFAHVFEAWRFEDRLLTLTPTARPRLSPDECPPGMRLAKCGHALLSHPGRQRNECDDCCRAAGRIPPPNRALNTRNLECVGCGTTFTRMDSGPVTEQPTCSRTCRYWINAGKQGLRPLVRPCARCGTAIPAARPNARYCTTLCAEVAAGKRLSEPLPKQTCALPECSVVYQPKYRKQRCCNEKHGKLLSHREYRAAGKEVREQWGDARRERYHRRRALKKQASTGEPVRFTDIAERDHWTCGLCHKHVDHTLAWPDPMSPSLDHVIPLSKGGMHDPSNVQFAHLHCNTTKNNRGGGEQLALIG